MAMRHRGRGKERCKLRCKERRKGHMLHRLHSRVRKGKRRRKACRMEEHNRVGASTTSIRGGVCGQEVGRAGGGKGSNSVTLPSPFALGYAEERQRL